MTKNLDSLAESFTIALKPASRRVGHWIRLVACAWVLQCFSTVCLANNDPAELKLVADIWCPYTCDADAARRGILVDITAEIFQAHGFHISYQTAPWERVRDLVQSGKADIALGLSPATVNDQPNPNIPFLSQNSISFMSDNTVLVWAKGRGRPYSGPQVLDGQRLGIGYSYFFDNGGELDQYLARRKKNDASVTVLFQDNILEPLIRMLLADRIDVFPEDFLAVQYLLRHNPPADLDLVKGVLDISETGKGNPLFAGFASGDRGHALAQSLDQGLKALKASGRVDEIIDSYRVEDAEDFFQILPLPEPGHDNPGAGNSGEPPARATN
jgi:polar amino acid transport system substrate-binding protein